MPDELRRLLVLLLDDIGLQSAAMDAGRVSVDEWQRTMAASLLTGHYAAYGTGRNLTRFSPQEQARINRIVGEQLDYLNRFAAELDTRAWTAADAARAMLYAAATKSTFWKGRTFGYDLEAYPGDGSTPCLVNCHCVWEIDEFDSENMDADFTWKLGTTEHCGPCIDRSHKWAPLRFRGGELI